MHMQQPLLQFKLCLFSTHMRGDRVYTAQLILWQDYGLPPFFFEICFLFLSFSFPQTEKTKNISIGQSCLTFWWTQSGKEKRHRIACTYKSLHLDLAPVTILQLPRPGSNHSSRQLINLKRVHLTALP